MTLFSGNISPNSSLGLSHFLGQLPVLLFLYTHSVFDSNQFLNVFVIKIKDT